MDTEACHQLAKWLEQNHAGPHEGRRPVEVAEPLDDDDPEARPAVAELGSECAA